MTFRQPVLAATALLMPFTTFAQEGNKKKKSAFICARLCHLRAMRAPGRSSYAMKNKDYLSIWFRLSHKKDCIEKSAAAFRFYRMLYRLTTPDYGRQLYTSFLSTIKKVRLWKRLKLLFAKPNSKMWKKRDGVNRTTRTGQVPPLGYDSTSSGWGYLPHRDEAVHIIRIRRFTSSGWGRQPHPGAVP